MPRRGNGAVLQEARNIGAFLARKGGPAGRAVARELEEQIAQQREMIASKDREIARLRTAGSPADGRISPENIVWMFGSGRTGSNWLMRMMAQITNCARWQEPMVGALFAFYYASSAHHANEHFILGSPHRETWLRSIRSFVLEGADARFPEMAEGEHLIIREPTGSLGAPLLMEALPESRLIFLIRDPRDVVASLLDGSRKGGWLYERGSEASWRQKYSGADSNPNAFVKKRADMYASHVGRAKQAYDAHTGRKVLVKYEDLRVETLGTMRRLYDTLGILADEEDIARAVKKHSWENLPEERKGEGKFNRKATPGGWREDLTSEQVKTVEEITAPLLNEFYAS